MNKLTIEEINSSIIEVSLDMTKLVYTLKDTMQENERLRRKIMQAVGGMRGHGDKYEAIAILEDALGHSYPYKELEDVG